MRLLWGGINRKDPTSAAAFKQEAIYEIKYCKRLKMGCYLAKKLLILGALESIRNFSLTVRLPLLH